MQFSYEVYYTVCFIIPIIVIFAGLLFIVLSTVHFLRPNYAKKHRIAGYVFSIIIVGIVLAAQCRYLCSGGIYLATEKEHDALVRTVVIENVLEPSKRLPGFKSNHKHGADIMADTEMYFAVSCGDFVPGDSVTIEYLPRSRFILEITEAEP